MPESLGRRPFPAWRENSVPPVDELEAIGLAAGLDAFGVAPAEPFLGTRQDLRRRRAEGLHGGMHFTFANPDRSTDPSRSLAGARALVVGARSYRRASPPSPGGHGPVGRVAAYAWNDHYAALRRALDRVADRLQEHGWRTLVLVDDNRLVDREAAVRAGLGWYGKNTNVLLPGRGSWFVLGSVVTDAPLSWPSGGRAVGTCGSCTRCLPACPTGAIVEPGVLDARRCLAHLLQAAGTFPRQYRVALGDRLYGCDDCQEVCPPNRREERGGAAAADPHDEAEVRVLDVLAASDQELLDRHGRWYIPRRQPRYLRRNALIVLGNVGDGRDPAVAAAVQRCLESDEPVERAAAVWAAARLGLRHLVTRVASDVDPEVQAELRRVDDVPELSSTR